jgi:hypothetical protein
MLHLILPFMIRHNFISPGIRGTYESCQTDPSSWQVAESNTQRLVQDCISPALLSVLSFLLTEIVRKFHSITQLCNAIKTPGFEPVNNIISNLVLSITCVLNSDMNYWSKQTCHKFTRRIRCLSSYSFVTFQYLNLRNINIALSAFFFKTYLLNVIKNVHKLVNKLHHQLTSL